MSPLLKLYKVRFLPTLHYMEPKQIAKADTVKERAVAEVRDMEKQLCHFCLVSGRRRIDGPILTLYDGERCIVSCVRNLSLREPRYLNYGMRRFRRTYRPCRGPPGCTYTGFIKETLDRLEPLDADRVVNLLTTNGYSTTHLLIYSFISVLGPTQQ